MADGKIVIVAGFQGQSAKALELAETTTLGRGGSDTTAVALAAALRADRCQIYTDVKGIYTADPRLVPDARQLPVIGYEEMLELAHQGAQVMQVRAVELGWVNDVVIEVLSSFEDAPGTLIKEDPLVEQRNKVRGIAQDRNVAKVTLVEVPDRPGVAHAVFAPLADSGISVDMIVQNVGHGGTTDMSFTVPRVELAKAFVQHLPAPDPAAMRALVRASRALVGAWLDVAQPKGGGAEAEGRAALRHAREARAPWWVARAIRLLGAIGSATPSELSEATEIEGRLGVAP